MSKKAKKGKQSNSKIRSNANTFNHLDWNKFEKLLKNERNYIKYCNMLSHAMSKYCICIAVSDTFVGPNTSFRKQMSLMNALNTKYPFSKEGFRHSYAAIVCNKTVVFEQISSNNFVHGLYEKDDTKIEVYSCGFVQDYKREAWIKVNDETWCAGIRGVNILVYDMANNNAIDNVSFDLYSDNCLCERVGAIDDSIVQYIQCHPELTVIHCSSPPFPTENLNDYEQKIKEYPANYDGSIIWQNPENYHLFRDLPKDYVERLLIAPKSYINTNGVRRFYDFTSDCLKIKNGHRATSYQDFQKTENMRNIFLIGGCNVYGVGNPDEFTAASQLQKMLNDNCPERNFCVQNYGFFLWEENRMSEEEPILLNSLPTKAGDIVVCFFGKDAFSKHLDFDEKSYDHSHGEIFYDCRHYYKGGHYLIAKKIFDDLQSNDFYSTASNNTVPIKQSPSESKDTDYGFSQEQLNKLEEYKNLLKSLYETLSKDDSEQLLCGSIVMNCNPFTNGHRYLIEQASKQVDYLFVFIVQEDKSDFPFADRLALVEKGTSDLQNVFVMPSGQFIISLITFSGYFNKKEIQDEMIDTSLDVVLFAKEIAPCLNISIRFCGTEPTDNITRQYNESLAALLPKYGIRFIEIPRIELNGSAVSASAVRKLLEVKDYDVISKLVPPTTLEYLLKLE